MISRLEQILTTQNITKSQLADMIKVSPATISHLMSGRNKPSYEIIQAIGKALPNINLEWLINGTGKMYKDGYNAENSSNFSGTSTYEPGIFDSQTVTEREISPNSPNNQRVIREKRISKITIFYTDGTFQDIPVK